MPSDHTRTSRPEILTQTGSISAVANVDEATGTGAADNSAVVLGSLGKSTGDPAQTTILPAHSAVTVPGYVTESELGRGAMGVVYLDRDTPLNREMALKIILRADSNRVAIARFWAEAEIMAAVKHPKRRSRSLQVW